MLKQLREIQASLEDLKNQLLWGKTASILADVPVKLSSLDITPRYKGDFIEADVTGRVQILPSFSLSPQYEFEIKVEVFVDGDPSKLTRDSVSQAIESYVQYVFRTDPDIYLLVASRLIPVDQVYNAMLSEMKS
jgi:hypothetical protein